jgi:hypothetical protein
MIFGDISRSSELVPVVSVAPFSHVLWIFYFAAIFVGFSLRSAKIGNHHLRWLEALITFLCDAFI